MFKYIIFFLLFVCSLVPGIEIKNFNIALKQQNLDLLKYHALDVSNPDSENYGKYWSIDRIQNLISPLKETTLELKNWLNKIGVWYIYHGD